MDWIEVSTLRQETGATRIDLRVKRELLRPGIRTGQLILHTSSAIRPDCSIYLRVRGVASLLATPNPAFLERGARQRVSFRRPDGTAATLARATSDYDSVAVEIIGGDQVEISELGRTTGSSNSSVLVEDNVGRVSLVLVRVRPSSISKEKP